MAPSVFFAALKTRFVRLTGSAAIFSLDLGPEPFGSLATPLSLDERNIPERRRYVTAPELKNRICPKAMQNSDWYTHECDCPLFCQQLQLPQMWSIALGVIPGY
jgi:hypothetical protein